MAYRDCMNEDFAALGLDDDCDRCDWLPPMQLEREAPVFRSASSLLLGSSFANEPDVYRSVIVPQRISSTPSPHMDRFTQFGGSLLHHADSGPSSTKGKLDLKNQFEEEEPATNSIQVGYMSRKIADSVLAPIYAFSDEGATKVVAGVQAALEAASVDFRPFNPTTSCFTCRARDQDTFRFDVYVLELLESDKAEHGQFIIEIQRLSSNGSCTSWTHLIRNIMDTLETICKPSAYFSVETKKAVASSLVHAAELDVELDTESEAFCIDDAQIDAEYRNMLAMLTERNMGYENKCQIAKLLGELAGTERGLASMSRVGALETVLTVMQREVLYGNATSELTSSLCKITSALAPSSCNKSSDFGACVTMEVLKNGSDDKLDLEPLRQAAKALARFSKHLNAQTELRAKVRETVLQRCSRTQDAVLEAHSSTILQNLVLCA